MGIQSVADPYASITLKIDRQDHSFGIPQGVLVHPCYGR